MSTILMTESVLSVIMQPYIVREWGVHKIDGTWSYGGVSNLSLRQSSQAKRTISK